MTPERIDFYLLNRADNESRLGFACLLAAKAWRRGLHVYMQVDTLPEVQRLDKMLWQFQKASFVPHARIGTPQAAQSPVLIGNDHAPDGCRQMLVSLTRDVPNGVATCHRVVDLIVDSQEHRTAGRERFRAYCAMGIRPNTHEIKL